MSDAAFSRGDDPAPEVVWFESLTREDVVRVGGKNASLGEMVARLGERGVRIPGGFATTAEAFRHFLAHNDLEAPIGEALDALAQGRASLAETGATIRRAIRGGEWPESTAREIREAYAELCRRAAVEDTDVAVRSSATAEDLPEASFAGQQESFLNVRGAAALLDACRRCYASLYTDRAISYRENNGFEHLKVALSVGVQQMVRSDLSAAGVMFSIDTETGCDRVVVRGTSIDSWTAACW